jgi:hypothetical protein
MQSACVRLKPIITKSVAFDLCLLSAFSALVYFCFIFRHYSIDAYATQVHGSNDYIAILKLGRPVQAVLSYAMNLLHLNAVKFQSLFTIISFPIISLSELVLLNILCSDSVLEESSGLSKCLIVLAVITFFHNVFIAEWFIFSEAILLFILSFAFAVLSLHWICRPVLRARDIILALLFLGLSMFGYQVSGTLFVIIYLIWLISQGQRLDRKGFAKKLLIGNGLFVLCGVANVLFIVLLPFGKTIRTDFSTAIVVRNLTSILQGLPQIWEDNLRLMPQYGYLVVLSGLLILFFVLRMRKDNHRNNSLLFLLVSMLNAVVVIFSPHLLTSYVWMAPRTIVGFMILPAIVVVAIVYEVAGANTPVGRIYRIGQIVSIVILAGYFLMNVYGMQRLIIGNIVTTKLDFEYARRMASRIGAYESRTGIVVKRLAFRLDKDHSWFYDGVLGTMDLNVRGMCVEWARYPIFELATGRKFESFEMDDNFYEKYFKDKKLNHYDEDQQIVLLGDSSYVMIF